jgi:hypothetical protein
MKKLLSLVLVLAFGFATASAMACPKGQEMTGGTGKHHKGGTCTPKVAKDAAPASKEAAPMVKDAAKK